MSLSDILNRLRSPPTFGDGNIEKDTKGKSATFDLIYRTGTWCSHNWTKQAIESRLVYALDVDKGGRLTGKEIQLALREIGSPNLTGKKVLDYCCGTGMTAIYLALCGAEVWAFDVSAEAIKIAKKSAQMSGVSHAAHFCVADAQALPYEDDFFDVMFCLSALHIIIDYPKCPFELSRVLKTGGTAVFCEEGLGYNPFFGLIRWLKRHKWAKSGGGRHLKYPDIEKFGMPFSQTNIQHFNLLMQMKMAFTSQMARHGRLKPWSKRLLRAFDKADVAILTALPCLKKYCGAIVVSFVK